MRFIRKLPKCRFLGYLIGYPALKEDVLHTICQNPIPRIPNYCVFSSRS